jgi:CubicO group peptidase (beta-lactamase class C family)
LIVEHVTGMSLAAYEQKAIFAPAGLTETTVGPPPTGTLVAAGHMRASGPPASLPTYSWFYACGDIFSTAGDLARFDAALMNGTLVSPATLALMQSDSVETDGHFRQGLGLMIVDLGGLRFVGHHGGVPGFETENELVPASGVAMIVLGSSSDFQTSRAYNAILPAVFPTFVPPGAFVNDGRKEDPVITARFKDAVNGLISGTVDLDQYGQAARDALTPAAIAQTSSQLKALGAVAAVVYEGHSGTTYRYRVTFTSGNTLRWLLTLGEHGRIDGLIVDPQQ